MRRSYRLTALFPFWACAFHSTCSWFYRAPRILLPNSLQLRQPGDSLLSQQTSKRLRMTVEQHCLGVQRLPRGSSFAPTPWNHTEGTTFPGRERACKGCFVFSTPSPAPTTSLPPTAKAGTSPLWSWMVGPLQQWRQCPLVAAGDTPHERCPVHPRPERKARSKPTSALSIVSQTWCQLVESWH